MQCFGCCFLLLFLFLFFALFPSIALVLFFLMIDKIYIHTLLDDVVL